MSSASDYMVGNAPQGASYAAPNMSNQLMQGISGMPQDYFQGQQRARTLELQKPILDPATGQPTMNPDIILPEMARRGGMEYVEKLLPFMYQERADRPIGELLRGGTGPATGPANLATRPQATSPGGPPVASPQGPQGSQPMSSTGMDDNGQDTIRTIATAAGRGKDMTNAIGTISRTYQLNPDAPLQPDQVQRVKTFLANRVGADANGQNNNQQSQPQAAQPQPDSVQTDDDPTLGGLVPKTWIDGGHTATEYRDLLAALASRVGVSPGAKDAALKRMQTIDDYLSKGAQAEHEFELSEKKTPESVKVAKQAGYKDVASYEGAKTAATEEAKNTSDTLKDLSSAGIEAKGQIGQLDVVQKLGDKVGFGTAPKLQAYLGNKFGIETKGLSDIQAYERAIDYMAPQLRPIGSGRLMQQELNAFKAALGGLMTTPEGRRISVNNLGLIARYKAQIGEIAADAKLTPQQRMEKIYQVPPPQLVTEAPGSAPGTAAPTAQTQPPVQGARKASDGKWYVKDPQRSGKYLEVRQ